MAEGLPIGRLDETTVRRLWWAALDTLQEDILAHIDLNMGIWLASPLPALYESSLLKRLRGWVWAPEEFSQFQYPNTFLLPPSRHRSINETNASGEFSYQHLRLLKEDGHDPLLIIITPEVQVALALQGESGHRSLILRSDPETLGDVLKMLDLRLEHEDPFQAMELRKALANLGQLQSQDGFEETFWPLLSERLAGMPPSLTFQAIADPKPSNNTYNESAGEITLLEALAHEVRTPLATIRTLIRSLLKRKDLAELVITRLQQIDSECTEQIDRFGLIFNAAELQREKPKNSPLASTDLGRMLEMLRPVWSFQLERRGIKLHLDITPDLPKVLSDPEKLELMLGGLIDRNSRSLKPGGTLVMELRPAGQRLKLQILSKAAKSQKGQPFWIKPSSDLGPVLSWDPSTGSLQLTQAATQQLLASLGGRLIRRRDSGLTVFFPISEEKI